jgi:hypothetical protein
MTVPTTPPDAVNYSGTALVDVIAQGNQRRVILLYAVNDTSDPGNPVNRLVYVLLDGSGGVVQAQTELYQRNAGGMDGIQLSNGGITLTWTDLTEGKVNYAILGQDFSKPAQPAVLENPDGRAAGVVSVTRDANGGAILTWMDVDWYQRLYYALVNAGGVLTQPMIFKYAPSGGAYKLETRAALGNAVYNEPKWRIFLSYIVR